MTRDTPTPEEQRNAVAVLRNEAGRLRRMADEAGLPMLAYLFSCAELEAESCAQGRLGRRPRNDAG